VHDPIHAGVGSGCSSGNCSSPIRSDISLDSKVREEGSVNVGTGCAAAAEVHRVGTVETHTVGFGLDVAGVLFC
jgi:hypothetical protein